MTEYDITMHRINHYLSLPARFQDPELVAIYTEYKSNLLRIQELSNQLRTHTIKILMSGIPTENKMAV